MEPTKVVGNARPLKGWRLAFLRWFKGDDAVASAVAEDDQQVDWVRMLPFAALHLSCLGVLWVGWSPIAVAVAVAAYWVRMFAITGFYHRYFSHRTFKTSRPVQFLFAVLGNTAVQRGPLWWAGHHRHHHRHSDVASDVHSPKEHGFWITMGEGWHNNHHYYPGAARQGFYWWEFDPTYYLLKVLSWIGLVRDLRPVPERVYDRAVSGP